MGCGGSKKAAPDSASSATERIVLDNVDADDLSKTRPQMKSRRAQTLVEHELDPLHVSDADADTGQTVTKKPSNKTKAKKKGKKK